MDVQIQRYFTDLESKDKVVQYEALNNILDVLEKPVDWAYDVWDQLILDLTNKDNHKRSRAAQFLSYLAISDPEKRILDDFPAIWEVTKDPKFVTARHSLQVIWRIGLAGENHLQLVLGYFSERFVHCIEEKNYTLIRYDIIQGLKHLYEEVKSEDIKQKALELIELEENFKYQKKYAVVWRHT